MDHRRRRQVEELVIHELLLALGLLALAIVQAALLPRPLGVTPNLMLVLVICHGLIVGPTSAARWALYGGVGLDLCSGGLLGSHALALIAATLASTLPLIRLSRGNWLLPLVGVALGAAAYHAVLALITTLNTAPVDLRMYTLVAALPDAAAALVPALPIYMLLRWQRSRSRGEMAIDVY
jgi:cell shape-determining protein MreD